MPSNINIQLYTVKKLLLPLLVATTLVGCASFPADYTDQTYGNRVETPEQRAVSELNNSWTATKPLTYVKSTTGTTVWHMGQLPPELASKSIELTFGSYGSIGVEDLIVALRPQKINVVSRLQDTTVPDLKIPEFKGTLQELLDTLAQVHNISYEYRKGVLFLTERGRYSVSLPQHEGLLKKTVEGITSLGGSDAIFDLGSGKVYFGAKPDVLSDVEAYVQSVSHNSAMVSLQVAVLTVGHNRDRSVGFDWANAAMSYGVNGLAPGLASEALGALGQINGSSLGYTFSGNGFSLTAALNAMSKYGSAKTEQNVTIGTLSGLPVKITSGNEIPYVKSIGSSISSGGSVAGSSETGTISSGLSLEVTPQYDNKDRSIITAINVDLSTLVGFRELSAGASLGTLSQPEIQKITFNNVSRMGAGATLVIGGLSYDQLSNNYQTLPGLEATALASSNQKVTRQTIYIVVRPTVVLFTPDADKLNAELAKNSTTVKVGSGDSKSSEIPVAASIAAGEELVSEPSESTNAPVTSAQEVQ